MILFASFDLSSVPAPPALRSVLDYCSAEFDPRPAEADTTDLPKGVWEGVLRGRPSLQPTPPPRDRAWRSGGVPRGGPRPQPPGAIAHGHLKPPGSVSPPLS